MKNKISVKETAIFAMLAALIFASKKLMEILPNIHLVGVFIVAITVVYRWKALIPIYTYVILDGIFLGFSLMWLPYLYIWAILWGAVMLIPKSYNGKFLPLIYMTVCGLHGLLFGVLYSPAYALLFRLDFKAMLAWIATGLPFDLLHFAGNFCLGLLICPIISLLRKLDRKKQ